MFETTNQQPSISDFPNFKKKTRSNGPTSRTVTISDGFHQSFYVFGKNPWNSSNFHRFCFNFHRFSQVFPRFFPGFPRFSLALPGPPWVPLKVHRSPRQAEEPLQDAVQKTLGPGPWDAQNHLTSDEAYADGAVDGRNPINHQFKAINHLFMYIRIFINQWFI